MLVSMKEMLEKARREGYGVTAANIFNEDTVRACIEAAEEEKAPMIINFAPALVWDNMPGIARIALYFAQRATVPVALNLDHGASLEHAAQAIHAGLTSVMVDRSTLAFEDNVREVAEITRFAHACGVSVEAELGHVGDGEAYATDGESALTDPAQAREYVRRTGVDCLAVAVGTAHGEYSGTPKIHFDRLQAIAKEVEVPLVLHGGSGTGDENLAKACRMGIAKVNLFTDLSNAGLQKLREDGGIDRKLLISEMAAVVKQGYKEKLIHYIKLFGQSGRA